MLFNVLFSLEFRRQRLLKKAAPGPLRDFLSVPFPSPKSDCRTAPYIALDLETTGLDARRDEILSVGFVAMEGIRVDLGSASRRLVAPEGRIPERTAVIHRITDDTAARGERLDRVMEALLEVLAGRVLLAHHARVEISFLRAACDTIWGEPFLIPLVDTQWIERRTLAMRGSSYAPKSLSLSKLRERYNLPRYRAHDALSDAVATAELFAAQIAERDNGGTLPLRHFLSKL